MTKETYHILSYWQKRPIVSTKKTCYIGKRDLVYLDKKPIIVRRGTYYIDFRSILCNRGKVSHQTDKRDVAYWQKRPIKLIIIFHDTQCPRLANACLQSLTSRSGLHEHELPPNYRLCALAGSCVAVSCYQLLWVAVSFSVRCSQLLWVAISFCVASGYELLSVAVSCSEL